jgi:hypothetical protein
MSDQGTVNRPFHLAALFGLWINPNDQQSGNSSCRRIYESSRLCCGLARTMQVSRSSMRRVGSATAGHSADRWSRQTRQQFTGSPAQAPGRATSVPSQLAADRAREGVAVRAAVPLRTARRAGRPTSHFTTRGEACRVRRGTDFAGLQRSQGGFARPLCRAPAVQVL